MQSCQQGKELNISVEDGGPHSTPSLKKSPKEGQGIDGTTMATMEEEEEVVKDRSQLSRSQRQQPSTGPASRATHGSSTSIPFIDCSDVDSEYDLLRGQMSQSHSQTNDNYEGDLTSGVYVDCRGENHNKNRYKESSTSPIKAFYKVMEDCIDNSSSNMSFSLGENLRFPQHSTLVEEMFNGPDIRSPLATPLHSSSKRSSPLMSVGSPGTQIFEECRAKRKNNDGHTFSYHNYTRFSPALQRPQLQRFRNACNKSETDPFILSQGSSTSGQEYTAERFCKRQMVPLEGKNMANGMPATAPSKRSPIMQSLYARGMMDRMPAVQMTEGSTSSGTESSDSDSEMVNSFTQPLVFSNPIVLNSSPGSRNKYPSSSLQLSGEAEDDKEGPHVFSC